MARTPRIHNPRSTRLTISGETNNDTPGATETLNAGKIFPPIMAGDKPGLYSFWIDVGAGLNGTFVIQGTNVPDPEQTTDADWTNLSPTVLGSLTFAGSAANVVAYGTDQLYEWIRLKFSFTSGSGTFRCFYRVSKEKQ